MILFIARPMNTPPDDCFICNHPTHLWIPRFNMPLCLEHLYDWIFMHEIHEPFFGIPESKLKDAPQPDSEMMEFIKNTLE